MAVIKTLSKINLLDILSIKEDGVTIISDVSWNDGIAIRRSNIKEMKDCHHIGLYRFTPIIRRDGIISFNIYLLKEMTLYLIQWIVIYVLLILVQFLLHRHP